MNLYFAPMEGITTYTFRSVHIKVFGGCSAYFAPFITPTANEKVGNRCFRDILPRNNEFTWPKVQLLSNDAPAFLDFSQKIKDLGYTEVNLNLGCPSSTVVKKGRGAGFLRDIDALDRFLFEIFKKCDLEITVKTRIGFASGEELDPLIAIYNKYPIKQLCVHPRTREAFYNGVPDMEAFKRVYNLSNAPLCYNGNIFSKEDFLKIKANFPNLEGVMLGRGAVANPAIFREINGGEKLKTAELLEFHHALADKYLPILGSQVYTLHKLKEIWMYIMWNFPNEKKILKAIKKSSSLSDLSFAISCLPELR